MQILGGDSDTGLRIPPIEKIGRSEFEVQAQLFADLKAAGFTVRGEVTVEAKVHQFGEQRRKKTDKAKCRFDLLIFNGSEAVHIVETKAHPVRYPRVARGQTRQAKRYACFGLPVTFVYGADEAKQFVQELIATRETWRN